MKPSIVAPSLKKTVLTYLTSTFGLVEDATADALAEFFSHPTDGLFQGPFLRVRAPFRPASEGWQRHLDWYPQGFTPHLHQAKAWERLSSRRGRTPEPTVVATGTGSGKTESFLVPVLDHCARHASEPGVKAVIIYPMNALATDQAGRLDDMLAENKELAGVTAGLYVGEQSAKSYKRLLTERSDMRQSAPDLLLTNYKMLDLLLTRAEDAPLWADGNLAYIVVDEFHTFNGAQGTDVAMLLRRLKAACNTDPTPVATSATLGDDEQAREVASSIFGRDFGRGSVIGEDRLTANEFVKPSREPLPEPSVADIAALPDPYENREAIANLCEAVLGSADLTPSEAGEKLRGHKLLAAVLDGFKDGKLITADQFYDSLSPWVMDPWKQAWNSLAGHDDAIIALERLLALISWARIGKRPLLHVETHFWIRSVSRLLRSVPLTDEEPIQFAWSTSLPESGRWLPAVSCRHCGRSGWMAKTKPPRNDELKLNPAEIYVQARVDRKQTRALIAAYSREEQSFDPKARIEDNPPIKRLDGETLADYLPEGTGTAVLVDVDSDESARSERCPACGNENAIRFIGAGLATLSSVVLTEVFQHAVDPESGDQSKALLFNDSVQDAAHRAGFLSARAGNFSLRTHLAAVLQNLDNPDLAEAAAAALVGMAENPEALGGVIPADLHPDTGVAKLLSGDDQGSERTWRFIGQRLALSLMLEFGLRSYAGRTLERTGVVATTIDLPEDVRPLLRDALRRSGARQSLIPIEAEDLTWHARGVLDRLQMRGGIWHEWLREWVRNDGSKRWNVWGGREPGMPAFPDGVSAPTFMLDGNRNRTQFDRLETNGETWLTDWTRRVLHLNPVESRKYLRELMRLLADQGVISRISTGANTVYALTAGRIRLSLLSKADAERSQVGCDVCSLQRTVHPEERAAWVGTPCPRWRCSGSMREATWHDEYYFDRYTAGDVLRLHATEHTGILNREQRERVEEQFKNASSWDAPNVLTATSTLELGIDIGDLSTVALAGIPPAPASYVQRSGRAGRTTGNALTIAFADRRPRDLAYFTTPDLMINGEIRPPGARLEASAILRRQYTAFLVDKAARGALRDVKPLPRLAGQVFGQGRWLEAFTEAALAGAPEYGDEFCALFGDRIGPEVAEDLRLWANAGIDRDIKLAAERWEAGLERLRGRRDQLRESRKILEAAPETRPEKQRDLRILNAEVRAVGKRLSDIEDGMTAHTALTEGGLLPNYALIDSSVTLEATLTFVRQDSQDGPREYVTELRDYNRPASSAITEFAPGNHVYFRSYAHEVKGIDLGGKDAEVIEKWNICPSCASVAKGVEADTRLTCEHCGFNVSDVGNTHEVAVPLTVYSYDRAADIRIDDRDDSRDQRLYNTITTAEVTVPAQSWRSTGGNFGFDYTPEAVIRRINLGPVPKTESPGDKVHFAGEERTLNPFWVCTECGGTGLDTDPTGKGDPRWNPEADPEKRHHRHWCPNRDNGTQHRKVLLAHELDTEVLRFLLPMRDTEDSQAILSFQAALAAGINRYFRGDTSHLDTVTCTMADARQPGTDAPPAARVFTVLFDQLRSGTGYLKQVSDPDAMRKVLQEALKFCEECDCGTACHRCLLSYARERHYPQISRAAAVNLLERLLDNWTMEANSGIGDISLNEKADSRLEKRFNEALHEMATRNSSFSIEKAAKYERILTFMPAGAPVTRWRMRTQHRDDSVDTLPDYTFTRIDGPHETVLLYLDGFDYHAQPEFNRKRRDDGKIPRTSDDATKRGALISAGRRVFAATWQDVERLEGKSGTYEALVGYVAQEAAAQAFGIPVEKLKEEITQNPLTFLFDYLAHPDPEEQWVIARATCAALLVENQAQIKQFAPDTIEDAVAAMARGEDPAPAVGGMGAVGKSSYLRVSVGFAGHELETAPAVAEIVFDDDPKVDDRLIKTYREDWRNWLRWSNVLQFLAPEDTFALRAKGMLEPAPPREPVRVDSSFHGQAMFDELVSDEVRRFLEGLLADGASVPDIGEEHIDDFPAELAWPRFRVAVFPDPVGRIDPGESIAEYRKAGWRADTVSGWDRDELLNLLADGTLPRRN